MSLYALQYLQYTILQLRTDVNLATFLINIDLIHFK